MINTFFRSLTVRVYLIIECVSSQDENLDSKVNDNFLCIFRQTYPKLFKTNLAATKLSYVRLNILILSYQQAYSFIL
jgi:hypothetical protein